MNADRNSDESIVPSNQANNAGAEPAAESAEGRGSAKRNADQSNLGSRTEAETRQVTWAGRRWRETARKQPELQFTSLLHHVTEDLLCEAFFALKKTAAVGIDEVSWMDYEQGHEERITDLHDRLHRGAYQAQ